MTTTKTLAATTLIPAPLWSLRDLSIRLKRSLASLGRDLAARRLPEGIRLGRTRRWDPREIEDWLSCGCPDAKTWELMELHGRKPA